MSVNFTDNPTQNHKMLSEMDDKYRQLISACNEYTSRSPRTEAGIARKNIVLHIQEKASTDLIALSAVRTDFCSLSPEEQRQKDWNQLLDQSRTIHLTVKDFAAFGKETGGEASEVYRITAQNATVKGADGTPVQLSDTSLKTNMTCLRKMSQLKLQKKHLSVSQASRKMIKSLFVNGLLGLLYREPKVIRTHN